MDTSSPRRHQRYGFQGRDDEIEQLGFVSLRPIRIGALLMKKKIITDISSSYGSLEKPNWAFVEKRLSACYQSTLVVLTSLASVQETTDVNVDCSRVLWLKDPAGLELGLKLSLVGSYALAHGPDGVLSREQLLRNPLGMKVLDALKTEMITLLELPDVVESIRFEGEDRPLYDVLFSADGSVY